MRNTTLGVLALLLTICTGASTLGCTGSQRTSKKPFTHIVAEFRPTLYNGRRLYGRVLLHGAYIEDLPIRETLVEFDDVSLEKIRACGKTEILPFDAWGKQSPGAGETIILSGGEWHGSDVQFPLSDRLWPLPDCMEADLVVRAIDGRIAARLPIHVERTDKPKDTPDGGTAACPPPPAPDGGAGPPKPPVADGGAP